MEREVVGYIRSRNKDGNDCEMQRLLIDHYLEHLGMESPKLFIDKSHKVRRLRSEDAERAEQLKIVHPGTTLYYPEWEKMLVDVMGQKIGTIIVDRKERLYHNLEDRQLLDRIAGQYEVQIIEIDRVDWPEEINFCKVGIYHHFIKNPQREGIRTAKLIGDISNFYEVISSHTDWKVCGLYIDDTADKRTALPRLLERDDLDVILCKYYYLVNRKTLAFLQIVREMNRKGITLQSTEEGTLHYVPDGGEFLKGNLRAAKYECFRSDYEYSIRELTDRRFSVFFQTVAISWQIVAEYKDNTRKPAANYERMAENVNHFDVIVIESFGKLGESVNELMACLRKVNRPVYSLKEGLLYTDGKETDI